LPGAGEHYEILFQEIDSEWMALAHDDEIYHPEWLSTLVSLCTPGTVLAFGKILLRDLRRGYPTFHYSQGELTAGRYTGNEMKVNALLDGKFFPGQALIVRTDTIPEALKMMMSYEQYDIDFLMKCCEQGQTAVSDKVLATYTLHRSNTLGSGEYVDESSRRIHPCIMLGQWLDDVATELPADTVENVRSRLRAHQLGGEMVVLVKNWTLISPKVWKRLSERVLGNPLCTAKYKAIIHLLNTARKFPRGMGVMAMKLVMKIRGVRPQPAEMNAADVAKLFPSALEESSWRCIIPK
jgi:hypothetical protein